MKFRVLKIELPTYDGTTDDCREVYLQFLGGERVAMVLGRREADPLIVGDWYAAELRPIDPPKESA